MERLQIDRDRPLRVLVVKLSAMGDVIHATGCLRALRQALPAATLTLAVEERWVPVVSRNPHLDAIVTSSAQSRLGPRYLVEIRRTLRRHGPYDVAIDLQGNRRSAAWVYLSGAPTKAGRGDRRPGWQAAWQPDPSQHAVLVCAEICRGLGIPVADPAPQVITSARDEARTNRILAEQGLPRSGFVLLNPFSRWKSKSWPVDCLVQVIARLRHLLNVPIVLTGGADDREAAGSVQARLAPDPLPSLVGRMTLGEALCALRRARLVVSVDSGPMHAAAALGVPTVALFGPTHPERTGPWGAGHRVLQARRPPSHHAYRTDPEGAYMAALAPETVSAAVLAALTQSDLP